MTPRGRAGAALAAVVTALVVAACGVPSDKHYAAIRHDDIPFGIGDTTTTSTTTTTIPPATTTPATTIATEAVTLYYILNTKLAPVPRALPRPARGAAVAPSQVLAALGKSPD